MNLRIIVAVLVLALASLACSLGSPERDGMLSAEELQASFDKLPPGDATSGKQIFAEQPCRTCHVDLGVGPAFPGNPPLATVAETRKAGYSAELYLYESIVAPNAHVVPGFQKDIMPGDYGSTLSEQDLADLVAYLMTMK